MTEKCITPLILLFPPPLSVKADYQILLCDSHMRITDISNKTPYCHRTVQEALCYLEREGLVAFLFFDLKIIIINGLRHSRHKISRSKYELE